MTVEDRLREALAGTAEEVPSPPERWDVIERRATAAWAAERRQRNRWRNGGLAVAGLAAAVAAVSVLPGLADNSTKIRTHPAGNPTATTGLPAGTFVPPPQTQPSTAPAARPPATFSYQPLWPFRSLAEADNWQASYRAGGLQPWHRDAVQTALSFSSGYLGYHDITSAFGTRTDGTGVHVTVGFPNPNGKPVTAAVIHLRQFGAGPDAPWEVVGTDDADFSLAMPTYGAVVHSPIAVGGRITGVDESIKVQVLQLNSATPIGQTPGLAAGGTAAPWSTSVAFKGASDAVITIAASTGGHLASVERFTVTGARTSAASPVPGL